MEPTRLAVGATMRHRARLISTVRPTTSESSNLRTTASLERRVPMTEYTDAQKAHFKQQWAAMRRRQYIAVLPFLVFFGSIAILGVRKGDAVVTASDGLVLALLLALVVGSSVLALQNWRCPACRRVLGSEANPRFCSKCGIALK
jgi:hypothetical protein